jgi:hypothetical protein
MIWGLNLAKSLALKTKEHDFGQPIEDGNLATLMLIFFINKFFLLIN